LQWHNYFDNRYELFILKHRFMPNEKTDRQGASTENADQQRDNAAKGGPMTGPGNPGSKHGVSKPYSEDLQTQIAAKGGNKKKDIEGTDPINDVE
jgi:hypothetical protein